MKNVSRKPFYSADGKVGADDRIGVMFVCLGNICRSPMAEFIFADEVKKSGLEHRFRIASAATSYEEEGSPVHRGTLAKLRAEGVPVYPHYATVLSRSDSDKYDFFIGMEERNVNSMRRILGSEADGKIYRMLDFSDNPRNIADPWYTGNFDVTYDDIKEGCAAFLAYLERTGRI